TGNAGIGHGNFYLEKGVQTPEQIIAGIPNGFYVTELMGFGVNVVTGDYSRGGAGLWIRNGELAFAVSEVTIAGNLNDMLRGIEAIGSDLEFRGSVAAATIKMGEMTVVGKKKQDGPSEAIHPADGHRNWPGACAGLGRL